MSARSPIDVGGTDGVQGRLVGSPTTIPEVRFRAGQTGIADVAPVGISAGDDRLAVAVEEDEPWEAGSLAEAHEQVLAARAARPG